MSSGTEVGPSPGLRRVKMRLFIVVVVIFTLTCGGSFGMEDVVGSSGPGLTLILLLLIPIFWALPMALISARSVYASDSRLLSPVRSAAAPASCTS